MHAVRSRSNPVLIGRSDQDLVAKTTFADTQHSGSVIHPPVLGQSPREIKVPKEQDGGTVLEEKVFPHLSEDSSESARDNTIEPHSLVGDVFASNFAALDDVRRLASPLLMSICRERSTSLLCSMSLDGTNPLSTAFCVSCFS